ncbi:hypothetical protein YB2330_005799 [Saitoella coloradoensis]
MFTTLIKLTTLISSVALNGVSSFAQAVLGYVLTQRTRLDDLEAQLLVKGQVTVQKKAHVTRVCAVVAQPVDAEEECVEEEVKEEDVRVTEKTIDEMAAPLDEEELDAPVDELYGGTAFWYAGRCGMFSSELNFIPESDEEEEESSIEESIFTVGRRSLSSSAESVELGNSYAPINAPSLGSLKTKIYESSIHGYIGAILNERRHVDVCIPHGMDQESISHMSLDVTEKSTPAVTTISSSFVLDEDEEELPELPTEWMTSCSAVECTAEVEESSEGEDEEVCIVSFPRLTPPARNTRACCRRPDLGGFWREEDAREPKDLIKRILGTRLEMALLEESGGW